MRYAFKYKWLDIRKLYLSTILTPHSTKNMRHDKLERQLDLMLLLAGSRGMRVEDICERLDISRRNFYYYMEFFRDCGFIVNKTSGRYSIDRESPFFKRLIERVSFTEAELIILRRHPQLQHHQRPAGLHHQSAARGH